MARTNRVKTPAFLVTLCEALERDLTKVGVKPTAIELDAVEGTRLYRLRIIAPKFSKLGHFERQDLAWNLVRKELEAEQSMHLSTILTLTPAEAEGGYFELPAA